MAILENTCSINHFRSSINNSERSTSKNKTVIAATLTLSHNGNTLLNTHYTWTHTRVHVSACVLLLVCVIMATPSWTCAWCALVSVCDEPCLYLRVKTVTHATNCFTCVIIVYSVVLPFLMIRVKILSFYLFLTNFKKTEVLNSIVF